MGEVQRESMGTVSFKLELILRGIGERLEDILTDYLIPTMNVL